MPRRTTPPNAAAATVAPEAAARQRRGLLRRLRIGSRARLHAIDTICGELLAEELCVQLREAASEPGDEFVGTIELIRGICTQGLEFAAERFQPERFVLAGDDFLERLGREVHDFKNLVAGIKYACQLLLEQGDQRFLPFEESVLEIQQQLDDCIAEIDAARAEFAGDGVAGKTSSRRSHRVDRPIPTVVLPEPTLPTVEPGHILVVDDDRASRDFLARELRKQRHRVTLVEDGRQAIERLEGARYGDGGEIDLVLLDLWMRDVDGLTVLMEMKKDYGLRSIPVVMVSAHDEIDSVVKCIAYGADDYLTKPYEPRILQARVSSCLAKGQLRRQERLLNEQVRAAKQHADHLLHEIFPYTVAEELITSGAVKPRGCENVAVLFCDVVGFTPWCNERSPAEVVASLHELFTAYEEAIRACKVEKIKTIGDCMMVTAGLMQRFENPVLSCLQCGQKMIEAAAACGPRWSVRVGVHVGPVVAGMAGTRQYAFDVWGDTVNTAARIEALAEPGTIAVSEPAWAQVFDRCRGKSIGVQPLKGRKPLEVFRFEAFR